QLGVDHGLSLRDCLEGSGVTPAMLADPTAVVGAHQELALVRNLVRALPGVPGLGLLAGQRYHFTAYGILGFAIVSSRNLRGALEVALRYLSLTYAYTLISGEDGEGEMRLLFEDGAIPEDVRRFLLERDMAAALTLQREMFSGSLVPRALRL